MYIYIYIHSKRILAKNCERFAYVLRKSCETAVNELWQSCEQFRKRLPPQVRWRAAPLLSALGRHGQHGRHPEAVLSSRAGTVCKRSFFV